MHGWVIVLIKNVPSSSWCSELASAGRAAVPPQMRNCPAPLWPHLSQTFQHLVQTQNSTLQLKTASNIPATVLGCWRWSICLVEGGRLWEVAIESYTRNNLRLGLSTCSPVNRSNPQSATAPWKEVRLDDGS